MNLVLQQIPATGTAGNALPSVKAVVEDQFGNIETTDSSTVTISVARGPGGFATGSTVSVQAVNGVATFTNLILDTAGSYRLSASNGSLTSGSSSSITLNAAQAAKVVLQQVPATGTAGNALSSVTVVVEDQFGNVVTTDSSTVTISVASGPGGFATGSTISMAVLNGVATFSNLILTTAGSYTLSASDGSLTSSGPSTAITLNAAQAAKVVLQQIPATGTAGSALSSVTVVVEDQFGNIVTTDSSTVTLSVASGPGGFATGSTISVAAVNGVATFTNLTLATVGTYTLSASDGGLIGGTSNVSSGSTTNANGGSLTSGPSSPITLNAATAAKVVFQQIPTTGAAGNALASVKALVEDQFGNIVTTDSSTVTISVASGPGVSRPAVP